MFPNNIKLSKKEHYTVCVYNTSEQAVGAKNRFQQAEIDCTLSHSTNSVHMKSRDFTRIKFDADSKKRINTVYSYAK